jgi:DNA-binding MarR family transcriptional regulator
VDSGHARIWPSAVVELNPAQVATIVSAALAGSSLRDSLSGSDDLSLLNAINLNNPQLSQSLLRGLATLAAMPRDGAWAANSELAQHLQVSPSTSHRYLSTLVIAGLVEQHTRTRRYRRAQ